MSVMSLITTPGTPRSETSASCSPAEGGAVQCADAGGTDEVPGLGLGKPPCDGVAPALAEAAGEDEAGVRRLTVVLPPPQALSTRPARTTVVKRLFMRWRILSRRIQFRVDDRRSQGRRRHSRVQRGYLAAAAAAAHPKRPLRPGRRGQ